MTRIGGIGGGMAPARRAGRSSGGFALPGAAEGAAAGAAMAAAGVQGLLALQEAPAPPPVGERARRQAALALDELRGLQLDLLRDQDDPVRLERLAALAGPAEAGADPALRAMLGEVALRVRVELARRRVATASGG